MTRPFPAPGLQMRHAKRPPVDCAVCEKPIENPGPFQKVHPGACHREWNNRNSAKYHAKRKAAKLAKRARKRVGAIKGNKPARSPKYLAWIRTLACCVPGCTSRNLHQWSDAAGSRTEASHSGPHGISQKAPDTSALPICAFHHRLARDSYHNTGPKFFQLHGMKPREELVLAFNLAYAEAQRRDAA